MAGPITDQVMHGIRAAAIGMGIRAAARSWFNSICYLERVQHNKRRVFALSKQIQVEFLGKLKRQVRYLIKKPGW